MDTKKRLGSMEDDARLVTDKEEVLVAKIQSFIMTEEGLKKFFISRSSIIASITKSAF